MRARLVMPDTTQTATFPIYPLRPELAEATYSLYRATRDPHYLHVGAAMLDDLEVREGLYLFSLSSA
jgi:hypothetical protein